MDISALTDTVVQHWPFDAANYPALEHLPTSEHPRFALRHILMHQQRVCGELAEIVEPMDHGALLDDYRKLRLVTRNFLVNTLRLAAIAGITPDQLVDDTQHWANKKHVA